MMQPCGANRSLADWIADFEASDAEYDAGILISGETVMAQIRAVLDRLDPKPVQRRTDEVVRRR